MTKKPSLLRSILTAVLVVFTILVFAYGFQVTEVSFDEINSETRQASLQRVLRAIARPDLVEYEQTETEVEVAIYVPCQPGAEAPAVEDTSSAYMILTPPCADPRTTITIEGFNFLPNSSGPIAFIPPTGVKLNLGKYQSDADGYFIVESRLPPRPNEEQQTIRATTRVNIGSPRLTQSAYDTWDKIIETVFLALLATAFGIILAIPISFFAAKNLMEDIKNPMSSLALSIIGWPVGIALGALVANWIRSQIEPILVNPWFIILGIIVSGAAAFLMVRWALPQEEIHRPSIWVRLSRVVVLIIAFLIQHLFPVPGHRTGHSPGHRA